MRFIYNKGQEKRKEILAMEVAMWAIMALYGILGGVSTLAMVVGIPAIIIWKIICNIYKKAHAFCNNVNRTS